MHTRSVSPAIGLLLLGASSMRTERLSDIAGGTGWGIVS